MANDLVGASLEAQLEEIEVMQSIYGESWKCEPGPFGSFSIDLKENNVEVTLYLVLPESYPLSSPPTYTLSAPSLSTQQKNQLSALLDDVYLENIGESVLYQWVEKIREFITEAISSNSIAPHASSAEKQIIESILGSGEEALNNWNDDGAVLQNSFIESRQHRRGNYGVQQGDAIEIIHGEVITDRKSSFQGHLAKVTSQRQVSEVLEILMENKKIANATHNMYAYRITLPNEIAIQDCEDDGEAQAGSRMLHLLQILNVTNVLVIVSRWYGGIHLGSDRFRHINNATRQVIEQAGLLKKQASKS